MKIPKMASVHQIQKNYRNLFNHIMKTKEPLIVLNNNKPEVVILEVNFFNDLAEKAKKFEILQMKKAFRTYEREKKSGKLKKLNSLSELI